MHEITGWIADLFARRGGEKYGIEDVTQREHALQSAALAREASAPAELVAAALLHDIGHLLGGGDLPQDCAANLDDCHESTGFAFLNQYFGPTVAEPVRLHVAAKRYLCTVEPDYRTRLSPTSLKSFHDQGGAMNEQELASFRREEHFAAALRLRRWDDDAKDREPTGLVLEMFLPEVEKSLVVQGSLR
jgi:[1-hydroxy-2-(trimethylamino)ethyl]phosphonate dioxygenase